MKDAFDFDGTIEESLNKLLNLFHEFGIDMYFHEKISDEKLSKIKNQTSLNNDEIKTIFNELIK